MSAFLITILADSSLSFNKERDDWKKTGGELENVGFVGNSLFEFSTMPMFYKRGVFSWSVAISYAPSYILHHEKTLSLGNVLASVFFILSDSGSSNL